MDVATIFAEHHVGLVRLAVVMVGDQATAEDIVQEAFTRTHAGRPTLRDVAAVGTTVEPARLRPLIPPKRRGFRPRVRFVAV
ncbi:MAG: polymerase subunit sigma-24, partial [Nonomuraea muscovyensis]|nr:polymerase subunit sigma-24 [Nonomuraea muscovyensis]